MIIESELGTFFVYFKDILNKDKAEDEEEADAKPKKTTTEEVDGKPKKTTTKVKKDTADDEDEVIKPSKNKTKKPSVDSYAAEENEISMAAGVETNILDAGSFLKKLI